MKLSDWFFLVMINKIRVTTTMEEFFVGMVHHFRGELWDCNKHATGGEMGETLMLLTDVTMEDMRGSESQ